MGARERRGAAASGRLAVHLHDLAGDLAVGLALLKGSGWSSQQPEPDRTIEVCEQVLTELRQLSRTASEGVHARRPPASVRESLLREATTAGVDLELSLTGNDGSLADEQAELVRLAGREAIRNVKRHSGATRCRIAIDLSSCPFVLTARDWGAGIQPEARLGGGIALLEALAREMGAALKISSQPGLGVEFTLTGPRCVLTRGPSQSNHGEGHLRSVVADESAGSRKRVAPRRPIARSGQQIT
jgi:two-component system sensor histidine kinase DesK